MQASKCFTKIKKQSYLSLYLVPIFGYFQIIQENRSLYKDKQKL